MSIKDIEKIRKVLFENGCHSYETVVALHIAAGFANVPSVIAAYGTCACDSLRELQAQIEAE